MTEHSLKSGIRATSAVVWVARSVMSQLGDVFIWIIFEQAHKPVNMVVCFNIVQVQCCANQQWGWHEVYLKRS